MSGPYCETCEHFSPMMMAKPDEGECTDPAKRIYAGGNPINEPPIVMTKFECCEHKIKKP